MLLSVKTKKVQNKNNKRSSSATSTTNKSIRRITTKITTKTSSEWKLVCKGSPRLRHLSWLMSEQQRGKMQASTVTLTSSALTRKSVNKRVSEGSEMTRNWLTTLIATTTRSVTLSPQRIFNVQNVILLLLVFASGLVSANGLQCYMCGQYNEGVGSITPCLNYSAKYQHLYLKECSKRSEKYCVKYVSELSTVRDCATECVEKEIWETQTYCCTEDGCNASHFLKASNLVLILPPIYYFLRLMFNLLNSYRTRLVVY